MLIRKDFQGQIPKNKVVNSYNNSEENTYSCYYMNNNFSAGGGSTGGGSAGSGSGSSMPVGTMVPYGNSTPPANWLICDGSAISRTTYAELFAVIGTSYGSGDGSTTFNLPDKRGRVSVGLDGNDDVFNSIGNKGGEKQHTLTVDEMPSHTHESNTRWCASLNSELNPPYVAPGTNWGAGNVTTSATGGSEPHNILQPYEVDNWIIKAMNGVDGGIGDPVPIDSIFEYDGDTVPDGYEEVEEYIGEIIITSSNINPENHLGGTWELVKKEFSEYAKSHTIGSANCPFTKNSNVTNGELYVIRNGQNIRIRLDIVNAVALTDSAIEIGTFNWNALGITGTYASIIGMVGSSDGGNAIVQYEIHNTSGLMKTIEVIPKTDGGSVAIGSSIYFPFDITIDSDHMLDEACDKFYWKRTS